MPSLKCSHECTGGILPKEEGFIAFARDDFPLFHHYFFICSAFTPSFLGSSDTRNLYQTFQHLLLGLSQQIYKEKIGRTNSWIRPKKATDHREMGFSIGSFYPELLGTTEKRLLRNPASDSKTSKHSQAVSQDHNRTPNIVHKL